MIQVSNQYENDKWILAPEYKDSRTNVIGKAIGDCVAGKGVFADRNAADIITFEGTRPENYLQQHWNAVILYNYIHEALNVTGKIDEENYIAQIANVLNVLNNTYGLNNNNQSKIDMIKEQYRNYFKQQYDGEQFNKVIDEANKQIDKAVNDIQAYVDALGLNSCLWDFYRAKVNYGSDQYRCNLAPGLSEVSYTSDFNLDGWKIIFDKVFYTGTAYNEESDLFTKRISYESTFRLQNGKLYLAGLSKSREIRTSDDDWKDQDKPSLINDLVSLEKEKWILEQLNNIVGLPTKELLDKWQTASEAGIGAA